jgi:hypothetical protein
MTWTHHSYFAKAQTYWEKASEGGRDHKDFLLNACFTVEFTCRAALCYVNPALNAAFDTDSILFACGQPPNGRPKTIETSEALKRLQRLVPALTDAAEMVKIRALMEARNSELHGAESGFENLPTDSFLPSVYSFLVKTAEFSAINLQTILGSDDATTAVHIAKAMAQDRTTRVKNLIDICKGRFYSLSPEKQKSKRDAVATDVTSMVLTNGHHVKFEKCPACAQNGRLLAVPAGRSSPFIKDDELVLEVRVTPVQFSCNCCGLEIPGLDELLAAGFRHEYRTLDAVDPVDHFNIDPLEYIDHEEVAREYYSQHDHGGYNDE